MRGTYSFGYLFTLTYGEKDRPPAKGQRWSYQCPYCLVQSHSEVLGAFQTRENEFITLPSSDVILHSLIVSCTRCEGVSLVLWPYGEGKFIHPRTFPFPQVARNLFGAGDESVPAAILEDLRQAELALSAGAFYGAGLLLRRACQYICRDKGCTGKNLQAEIDALAPQHITADMAQLAHSVRVVGNEIAHPDAKTPAKIGGNDVVDCWEFVVELVKVIYIHPARREALSQRLTADTGTAEGEA